MLTQQDLLHYWLLFLKRMHYSSIGFKGHEFVKETGVYLAHSIIIVRSEDEEVHLFSLSGNHYSISGGILPAWNTSNQLL